MNRTLLLISEPDRVEDALRYARRLDAYAFVALDLEIEEMLRARGIDYISGKGLRSPDRARHIAAEQWTAHLLSARALTYRAVPLDKLLFFTLQNYLLIFLYWADVLGNLVATHVPGRLVVFDSGNQVFKTSGHLAGREIHALADCARTLGLQKGIEVEVVGAALSAAQLTPHLFSAKRAVFSLFVSLLNTLSGFRARGTPRIITSEFWHNLAPLAGLLSGAEVVLFDRTQLFAAGWKNAWHLKMRFFHFDDFARGGKVHSAEQQSLRSQWAAASAPKGFAFKGVSYDSHLRAVLGELGESAVSSALRDIDHAYSMFERLRPDLVLLRTSTSTQLHFGILAYVAKACGVASLEFTHGLEYYGEGSLDTRKAAEYVGVYGEPIKEALVAAGYSGEKLPIIGSPRFDRYTSRPSMKEGLILCTTPDFLYGVWFDSYDIDDYLRGVGHAMPEGAPVVVKLRSWRREKLMRELVARYFKGNVRVTRDTPVHELLKDASLSVMPYSTTALESLAAGVPLVLFAVSSNEEACMRWHFAPYAKEDAVVIAMDTESLSASLAALFTQEAARAHMKEKADAYLARHFAFDGHSSERAVRLIRTLSKKGRDAVQ